LYFSGATETGNPDFHCINCQRRSRERLLKHQLQMTQKTAVLPAHFVRPLVAVSDPTMAKPRKVLPDPEAVGGSQ